MPKKDTQPMHNPSFEELAVAARIKGGGLDKLVGLRFTLDVKTLKERKP